MKYKSKLWDRPLYAVWCGMKQRCRGTCSNDNTNRNYHDRGITVCEEWLNSFQLFESWAYEHGYKKGLQIDRICNDLGYSPDNCKFSTPAEQADNRRITIRVELDGKTVPASILWREFGLSRSSVLHKIKRYGLTGDQILKEHNDGCKRTSRTK